MNFADILKKEPKAIKEDVKIDNTPSVVQTDISEEEQHFQYFHTSNLGDILHDFREMCQEQAYPILDLDKNTGATTARFIDFLWERTQVFVPEEIVSDEEDEDSY